MADIKQAALWMEDGEIVRRKNFFPGFGYKKEGRKGINTTDNNIDMEPFELTDLLADDWEIA